MSVVQDLSGKVYQGRSAARQHLFTDSRTIDDILAACAARGLTAQLVLGEQLLAVRIIAADTQVLRIEPVDAELPALGPLLMQFSAWGGRFELQGEHTGAGQIRVVSLSSVRQRRVRRAPLPEGAASFVWAVADTANPVRSGASIVDLTPAGVRVFAPAHQTLPSAPFAAAVCVGELVVASLAWVTNVTPAPGGLLYGVALDDAAARAPLLDLYLNSRFPQCQSRRVTDPVALEKLMRDSGYLGLRDANPISEDWLSLSCAPSLSGDLVYTDGKGAPLGHFSMTRYFSKTWLIQQLAVVPEHPDKDLVKLTAYQFFASYPWIVDGEGGHFLGYYDRGKRWHKMFFERFVHWVGDANLACISLLDRFERATKDLPPAPQAHPDIEVGVATNRDLVQATALVRAHLSPLHASAMDIVPNRLRTAHLHEAFEDSGFERARQALVLHYRGELVGVALCEYGSTTLSLFNLFNIATLYFVTEENRVPAQAKRALAYAARSFYAARGELNPLLIAPEKTFDADIEPGTTLAETMGCLLFSNEALLQYEDFVDFQFGSYLDAKRVDPRI